MSPSELERIPRLEICFEKYTDCPLYFFGLLLPTGINVAGTPHLPSTQQVVGFVDVSLN